MLIVSDNISIQPFNKNKYNFYFNGYRDRVEPFRLPAANYETAHQSLDENGNLVNYTKDQYVLKNGYPVTCGAWKELCLYSTNPGDAGWTLSNATRSAYAAGNVGPFLAHKIISAGSVIDRVYFWRSTGAPASGAPTGKQIVDIYYLAGTSGKIRCGFIDLTAGTSSLCVGTIGVTSVTQQNAGSLTLVSDVSLGWCRRIRLLVDFTTKSNSLGIEVGPYSATAGQDIIVLGASVAGAVGTGDITTERPFIETTGSVITLSSLSADLTNGRGPRVTYASAPKLLTALQGASTNAQGQIEWTGTPSGLPAADNQVLACNTTQGLLVMKSDGSAQVNGSRYSATLASAFAANTESKIIVPYEPGELRIIKGSTSTVTDFSGTFGPVTTFGIGPGTAHMVHKSLKIFKRPRTALDGMTTVYSGTISGLLISAVAGTAFLDNLPAEILALTDGNHIIEVTDAAGKKLIGVAAAVGTSATIVPLVNNVTGITKANPGVVSSTTHGLSLGSLAFFNSLTEMTELNNAYKTVTAVGSANAFSINNTSAYTAAETTGGACGHKVTTPSANGVTLVSYLGSTTQSLMTFETEFAFNAASYAVTVKEMA